MAVDVPDAGADVEGCAVQVLRGYGVVGAFVVVVIVGEYGLRPFEGLVVDAGLDGEGKLAAPLLELEAELGVDADGAEEASSCVLTGLPYTLLPFIR